MKIKKELETQLDQLEDKITEANKALVQLLIERSKIQTQLNSVMYEELFSERSMSDVSSLRS